MRESWIEARLAEPDIGLSSLSWPLCKRNEDGGVNRTDEGVPIVKRNSIEE